jgi:hypothetical protein
VPTGTKLKGRALASFKNYVHGVDREVASIPMNVMVAQN